MLKKKYNLKKWLWIGVAVALAVLMIISFPPARHVTEVVLH